jgi:hypothetical protein
MATLADNNSQKVSALVYLLYSATMIEDFREMLASSPFALPHSATRTAPNAADALHIIRMHFPDV